MHVKIIYTGIDHPNHVKALDKFALGIKQNGDTYDAEYPTEQEPDCYVIFGSWKDRDQPHHNAKREVVQSGKPFVVIETPIFGRKPVQNHISDDCFRVGLNGFLNYRGKFVPDGFQPDANRLGMMCERLDVEIVDEQNKKGPIVLALQLPGDASLEGQDINKWFADWVEKMLLIEDKVVRFPQLPREYDRTVLDRACDTGWKLQQGDYRSLQPTLRGSRLTISYSSGFGTDSIIAGTPAIVDSEASFAYDVAHKDIMDLHSPFFPSTEDRIRWLSRLAYHQWFMDEFESGECWRHIKALMDE